MLCRPGWWIRFGGLSPRKQRHRGKEADALFHTPPRRSGVYAFPEGLVDRFLIGATCQINHPSNKVYRLLDETGMPLLWAEHTSFDDEAGIDVVATTRLKKLLRRKGLKEKQILPVGEEPAFVGILRKPRRFSYKGEVWHHLVEHVDRATIKSAWGTWVLSDFLDWEAALKSAIRADRRELHSSTVFDSVCLGWDFMKAAQALHRLPYASKVIPGLTPDHLEVFIERPH